MPGRKSDSKIERARKYLSGGAITREDSDDELGFDDLPWEWIYEDGENSLAGSKKRKRASQAGPEIVGARMGNFMCMVGDTVFLKSDDNQAWVGIITELGDDEETGEKSANFMWFSTPSEIRNKAKKRSDFMDVRGLGLCLAQWLTVSRMKFTSLRLGIGIHSPRSMAQHMSCRLQGSLRSIRKEQCRGTRSSTARSSYVGEAAMLEQPHTRMNSCGKTYIVAVMIFPSWWHW
jgi:hypothetical protein